MAGVHLGRNRHRVVCLKRGILAGQVHEHEGGRFGTLSRDVAPLTIEGVAAMKAIVLTCYGSPDDLELTEVAKPVPKADEVLIRVHASAVNDWEWALVCGKPLYIRALAGVARPRIRIMGCDVAGRIEAVGTDVAHLEPGDDVYGDLSDSGFGSFAEYVCALEGSVALKPRNITFEQAAAMPHAAMLAQQGLTGIGRMDRDEVQTLLINGAGGGVGTLGVQLAKLHGVEVTGVDSTAKQSFLRSLGFDHVIDYTHEDFTKTGRRYDLILDVKTNRSPFAYVRALTPHGTYVTVGGSPLRLVQCLMFGRWIARTRQKSIRILALKPNDGLDDITQLVEACSVVPSIDAVYPLSEVPRALQRFGEASHRGKIVISMQETTSPS